MALKEVAPQLGLQSYSCPHCGAFAHQIWFSVQGKQLLKPTPNWSANAITGAKAISKVSSAQLKIESTHAFSNLFLAQCFSCKDMAIWAGDKLVDPAHSNSPVEPHDDMPEHIKSDFIEAASIVDKSPRGAAALLRLCVQKLMIELGEPGKNINDDIKSLVDKGLDPEIQKALDIVRVVGNNAVHPGELQLSDDKATARSLLSLINIIVERRIAAKKRIDELFANLPEKSREAIARRDSPQGS